MCSSIPNCARLLNGIARNRRPIDADLLFSRVRPFEAKAFDPVGAGPAKDGFELGIGADRRLASPGLAYVAAATSDDVPLAGYEIKRIQRVARATMRAVRGRNELALGQSMRSLIT